MNIERVYEYKGVMTALRIITIPALVGATIGCSPTEANQEGYSFTSRVNTQSLHRVADESKLVELISGLCELIQCRGYIEVNFISEDISLEDFKLEMVNIGNRVKIDEKYKLLQESANGYGFYNWNQQTHKIAIFLDSGLESQQTIGDPESFLVAILFGELLHTKNSKLRSIFESGCGEADLEDIAASNSFISGLNDVRFGLNRKNVESEPDISFLCGTESEEKKVSFSQYYYNLGYDNLWLFQLAKEALNSESWPEFNQD